MGEYPKYKKINEHTIRIIVERADDVPVAKLLENKKVLEGNKAKIEDTLKAINDILAQAEKLGIVPEVKVAIESKDKNK